MERWRENERLVAPLEWPLKVSECVCIKCPLKVSECVCIKCPLKVSECVCVSV